MPSLIERLQLSTAVNNLNLLARAAAAASGRALRALRRLGETVTAMHRGGSRLQWLALVVGTLVFAVAVQTQPTFMLWSLRATLLAFLATGLFSWLRFRAAKAVVQANQAPVADLIQQHSHAYRAWFYLLQAALPVAPLAIANLLLWEGRFSLFPLAAAAGAVGVCCYSLAGYSRRTPHLLGICWQHEHSFDGAAAWHLGLRYQQATHHDLGRDNSRLNHLANLLERADQHQQIPRLPLNQTHALREELRIRMPRLLVGWLIAVLLILPALWLLDPAWMPRDLWPQQTAGRTHQAPTDRAENPESAESNTGRQEKLSENDAEQGNRDQSTEQGKSETRQVDPQGQPSDATNQNNTDPNGAAEAQGGSDQTSDGTKSQTGRDGNAGATEAKDASSREDQNGKEPTPNGAKQQGAQGDQGENGQPQQGTQGQQGGEQTGDGGADQPSKGTPNPSQDNRAPDSPQKGSNRPDSAQKNGNDPAGADGKPGDNAGESNDPQNNEGNAPKGGDAPSPGDDSDPSGKADQAAGDGVQGSGSAAQGAAEGDQPTGDGTPPPDPGKKSASGGTGQGGAANSSGAGDQPGGGSGSATVDTRGDVVLEDTPRAGDQTIHIEIPSLLTGGADPAKPPQGDPNDTGQPPKARTKITYREGRRAETPTTATQPLPAWVAERLKDHRAVNAPNQPEKQQ